jgi:hypothetical protein
MARGTKDRVQMKGTYTLFSCNFDGTVFSDTYQVLLMSLSFLPKLLKLECPLILQCNNILTF